MKQFYKELFEYNHKMNRKLLDTFNEHSEKIPERPIKWMNHILNVHHLWNNRIDRQQEAYDVWQIHSPDYLKETDLLNYNSTQEILDKFELSDTISYITTQGKAQANSIKDILFHVANHSTYHRGQITSDFSQSGLAPLVTDYIAFKWRAQ